MHIHGAIRKVVHLLEMMTKNIIKDASTLGLLLHGEMIILKKL
jgi:hypothetical protein